MGWASSGFYLGSRVAQIWKNWQRGSAEGLSLAMFGCAIAANVSYGAGILCRTYSWANLLASAPWILGSLGTVALDVVIFLQVRAWRLGGRPSALLLAPAAERRLPVALIQALVMQLQCRCHNEQAQAAKAVCAMQL